MRRRGLLWLCAAACLLLCFEPWSVEARSRRARRPHARSVSASYVRMRTRWHARASTSMIRAFIHESPRPALVLAPIGDGTRQRLNPTTDHGDFDATALDLAALALAEKRSHATHAIEPRLLNLVYEAVRHFNAPFVHVISGYRAEQGGSRHAQGRAIDIVLPGVSDRQLAVHLRKQGFVGVGTYSRAGFVHLDVRARSYFWSDNTAPGERSRPHAMLRDHALRQDALARKRGVTPLADAADTPEMEAPTEEGLLDDSAQTTEADVR